MNILNRYRDVGTRKSKSGKVGYRSILYPAIQKQFSDIYVHVNNTDRLDLLAHKYYGDSRYWWIIAQANHIGKGSMVVPIGTPLRIPKDIATILASFIELNKHR